MIVPRYQKHEMAMKEIVKVEMMIPARNDYGKQKPSGTDFHHIIIILGVRIRRSFEMKLRFS